MNSLERLASFDEDSVGRADSRANHNSGGRGQTQTEKRNNVLEGKNGKEKVKFSQNIKFE